MLSCPFYSDCVIDQLQIHRSVVMNAIDQRYLRLRGSFTSLWLVRPAQAFKASQQAYVPYSYVQPVILPCWCLLQSLTSQTHSPSELDRAVGKFQGSALSLQQLRTCSDLDYKSARSLDLIATKTTKKDHQDKVFLSNRYASALLLPDIACIPPKVED